MKKAKSTNINPLAPLLSAGLHLIPIHYGTKVPIPKQWVKHASNDAEQVAAWSKAYPNCSWGVVTGPASKIFVVDIDRKNGGEATWAKLTEDNPCPRTVVVKTGGGGQHLYFKYPALGVRNSASKIGKGIDIRGDGGQVLCPPSLHPNGTPYEWLPDSAPGEVTIAKAPKWLLDLIDSGGDGADDGALGDPLRKGERNNQIYTQALKFARQGGPQELALAAIMVWAKGEDVSKAEIEATVASAYKAQAQEAAKAKAMEGVELSDTGNAVRMVQRTNGRLSYTVGLGWHLWSGKHWGRDEKDIRTIGMAQGAMQAWQEDILAELSATTDRNVQQKLYRLHQWATQSRNRGKLEAMVSVAKPLPTVMVPDETFDAPSTHFLLNVDNGVLDLRTGKLTQHDPSLHISKLAPTAYDPKAKCPVWLETLRLAFNGNKELINYMQRALGYSLSGSTAESAFFILWGPDGRNGKSTIMETVSKVLGEDYAQMSDPRIIISGSRSDNYVQSSLAALVGTRVVSMNELPENAVLEESIVKQLTGGDTIQARFLYLEPFRFTPTFKVFMRTNEKPIIHGTNEAIWRRVKCIPFIHPIPLELIKSRDEIDAALAREHEGILAWLVKGFQEWSKHGLQDPAIVKAAVTDYREASDVVAQFWTECVIEDKTLELPRRTLYMTFREWYEQQGMRYPMTAEKFARRVADRLNQHNEVVKRGARGHQVAVWRGIKLNPEATVSQVGMMMGRG